MATKTVTGKLTRPGGGAIKGATVTAKISGAAIIASTQEIAPLEETTTTATDGTWSLTLQANLDLLPNDTYYTFKVGSLFERTAIVPQTAGPFKLEDIAATIPPTNIPLNGHVASLLVDGAVTFSAGPVALPNASIADAALSSNVVLKDNAQTISGVKVYAAPQKFNSSVEMAGPRPWFDVTADVYGAQGNGVQDDTTFIQLALNAAQAAGGGIVMYPSGIYKITATLNVTTFKGVLQKGAGVTTILRPTAPFTGTTLININQNQCEIHDMAIIPGSSTYTSNPAVDAITFLGPANSGLVENVYGYYNNGWFINAIPNGASGIFGLTMNNLYAADGKGGVHLSAVGVTGNPFSAFFNNVWMNHMKAAECFFFDSVHDVDGNNVFGVADNNSFACLRINGLSAGMYFTNVDIGGAAGYTGDTILIDRDGSNNVPQFITFVGGVCTINGRGANIWANGCDFVGFEFLQSATDGVRISGGSRLTFTACHWDQSNTSAGTAYDVNNQNASGFAHLNGCQFNSPGVTAVFNGIGGAQWYVVGGQNLPGVTITAGTAPLFLGFQNGGGTAPVSTLPSDLNFSTAGSGISSPNGDLKLNAKSTNNLLFQTGGSTQAFLGASAILTFVVGGGIDVSSAGILNVGGTNANSLRVGNATSLIDFRWAVTALGGGAAPTVGTIGGSGPATAAQNSWLKVNINGTASFIPVWR